MYAVDYEAVDQRHERNQHCFGIGLYHSLNSDVHLNDIVISQLTNQICQTGLEQLKSNRSKVIDRCQ